MKSCCATPLECHRKRKCFGGISINSIYLIYLAHMHSISFLESKVHLQDEFNAITLAQYTILELIEYINIMGASSS